MRERFRIKSIRNKLFLIVMLISGTALLIATLTFAVNDRLAARKTLIYIVSSQANIVGQNATAALSFLDREAAREVLSGLALQNHIEVARLYDADGKLFAEYSLDSVEPDGLHQETDQTMTFAGGRLELYQPVMLDNEQIGTVYVRANLEMLGNRVGNYSRLAFVVFGGSLLLTWLLTSRMHRAISTPVNRIVKVARQITNNNDYSVRADKVSDDELGELVDGINTMLDQIQQRDSQLAEYASGLEQRVADRTADLEALTEQFRHLAYHDELTGLPNRALFVDRLNKSIAHCERTDSKLAVMFLDLDKFKIINDTLGHDAGDELLIAIGRRIRSSLRNEDSVARLGGDEFTILVNDLESIDTAGKIAEKIVSALRMPVTIGNQTLQVTGSIGISIYPDDHRDADKLMTFADAAMYKAKLDPRTRYHFFMETLQQEVERKQKLKVAFRDAMAQNAFSLRYLPEVGAAGGKLRNVSVRAQWEHDNFGSVNSTEFIPLMDDEKDIAAITEWILTRTCKQIANWRRMGLDQVRFGIPLSLRQLSGNDLPGVIDRCFSEYGITGEDLLVEVAERELNGDDTGVLGRLNKRRIGIRIGGVDPRRHSLNNLVNAPVDSIHLDPSLPSQVAVDGTLYRLTSAVVQLCHQLEIEVAASGLHRPDQLETMRKLGCDRLSGDTVARPMSAREFTGKYVE